MWEAQYNDGKQCQTQYYMTCFDFLHCVVLAVTISAGTVNDVRCLVVKILALDSCYIIIIDEDLLTLKYHIESLNPRQTQLCWIKCSFLLSCLWVTTKSQFTGGLLWALKGDVSLAYIYKRSAIDLLSFLCYFVTCLVRSYTHNLASLVPSKIIKTVANRCHI